MKTMTVTVTDRKATSRAWGHALWRGPVQRTITINAVCPICGGPRGEPIMQSFFEDGESYSVHTWTNPCGHKDMYSNVLSEARERDHA